MEIFTALFRSKAARQSDLVKATLPFVIAESARTMQGMVEVFNNDCDSRPDMAGVPHARVTDDAIALVSLTSALPLLAYFKSIHPTEKIRFLELKNHIFTTIALSGLEKRTREDPVLLPGEINPFHYIFILEKLQNNLDSHNKIEKLVDILVQCYWFSARRIDGNASALVSRFESTGRFRLNAVANVELARNILRI